MTDYEISLQACVHSLLSPDSTFEHRKKPMASEISSDVVENKRLVCSMRIKYLYDILQFMSLLCDTFSALWQNPHGFMLNFPSFGGIEAIVLIFRWNLPTFEYILDANLWLLNAIRGLIMSYFNQFDRKLINSDELCSEC